jgi:hypothetical protein
MLGSEGDYGAGTTAWMPWVHMLWDYTMVMKALYRGRDAPDPVALLRPSRYSVLLDAKRKD